MHLDSGSWTRWTSAFLLQFCYHKGFLHCLLSAKFLYFVFLALKHKLLLLLRRFTCIWLCDPVDGIPPGSPIPGILQARNIYITTYKTDSQWELDVWCKAPTASALGQPGEMEWDGGWEGCSGAGGHTCARADSCWCLAKPTAVLLSNLIFCFNK